MVLGTTIDEAPPQGDFWWPLVVTLSKIILSIEIDIG
jgi:hypothetical protein